MYLFFKKSDNLFFKRSKYIFKEEYFDFKGSNKAIRKERFLNKFEECSR